MLPIKSVVIVSLYIAPVYDTVPDFWQMVWEQKVDAIVMLTGIFEGGKVKKLLAEQ